MIPLIISFMFLNIKLSPLKIEVSCSFLLIRLKPIGSQFVTIILFILSFISVDWRGPAIFNIFLGES